MKFSESFVEYLDLHLTGQFHCEEIYRDKNYSNLLHGL
jgi:hypothetical protein